MSSCIAYTFHMFDSLFIYSTLAPQSSVSFSFLFPWLIGSACFAFASVFWIRAWFSGGFITVCQCGLAVHVQYFFFFFLRTVHGLSLVFFNSTTVNTFPFPHTLHTLLWISDISIVSCGFAKRRRLFERLRFALASVYAKSVGLCHFYWAVYPYWVVQLPDSLGSNLLCQFIFFFFHFILSSPFLRSFFNLVYLYKVFNFNL